MLVSFCEEFFLKMQIGRYTYILYNRYLCRVYQSYKTDSFNDYLKCHKSIMDRYLTVGSLYLSDYFMKLSIKYKLLTPNIIEERMFFFKINLKTVPKDTRLTSRNIKPTQISTVEKCSEPRKYSNIV